MLRRDVDRIEFLIGRGRNCMFFMEAGNPNLFERLSTSHPDYKTRKACSPFSALKKLCSKRTYAIKSCLPPVVNAQYIFANKYNNTAELKAKWTDSALLLSRGCGWLQIVVEMQWYKPSTVYFLNVPADLLRNNRRSP